jgi:hypothetical protein
MSLLLRYEVSAFCARERVRKLKNEQALWNRGNELILKIDGKMRI